MKLKHAVTWSFLSELASKAIQPLVFVLLARFLTPEDFGVMAAALMVIAFSQIFWEAGLGKALVQRDKQIPEAASITFWINLGLGLAIATSLFLLASPLTAALFDDERITAVLRVLSAQILLGALSTVQTALFQKEMRFKSLFYARFASICFMALVSLVLAWKNFGYWALVGGTLAGQFAQLILLWKISNWRPSLSFNTKVAKQMISFGAWVGYSGLLVWFFAWGDSFFVGAFLGSTDLGLYRMGNVFVAILFGTLTAPLAPVAYSFFSKLQHDRTALCQATLASAKIHSLVLFPLAGVVYLLKDEIAILAFGTGWPGIGEIIGLTAITQAIAYTVSINQEAYRAIGRADVEAKVMSISMLIRLVFYIWSIQFGLFAFMIARLFSTILGVINHLVFSSKYLNLSIGDFFKTLLVPALFTLLVLTVAWAGYEWSPLQNSISLRVLTVSVITLLPFSFLVYYFERESIKNFLRFLKEN
jgi:O-antigen/teichoic acid export membrane protein